MDHIAFSQRDSGKLNAAAHFPLTCAPSCADAHAAAVLCCSCVIVAWIMIVDSGVLNVDVLSDRYLTVSTFSINVSAVTATAAAIATGAVSTPQMLYSASFGSTSYYSDTSIGAMTMNHDANLIHLTDQRVGSVVQLNVSALFPTPEQRYNPAAFTTLYYYIGNNPYVAPPLARDHSKFNMPGIAVDQGNSRLTAVCDGHMCAIVLADISLLFVPRLHAVCLCSWPSSLLQYR